MGYNLLRNGVYGGYNPLANHLLTSWDIQVGGGGFKDFLYVHPEILGEDEPKFDEHFFQMGWFNHQPGDVSFMVLIFFVVHRT